MEKRIFQKFGLQASDELLQKGQAIGVKLSLDGEWMSNTIRSVDFDQNTIDIELTEEFIKLDLMIGDSIQCKIITEDTVYIIDGEVKDFGLNNTKIATIEIDDIKKYPNERSGKRFTVNLCGRLVFENNEKSAFVIVKNISSNGLSIVSKEKLELHDAVDIDIVLWKKEVISVEGKVARIYKAAQNYKYGIEVKNMDSKSKLLLNDFVEELEYFENVKKYIEEN